MGRISLRDVIGVIKDKVSLSKAALLSKPSTISLHLAVLRATTHSPFTPPDDHHITALLVLGDSSRATASALVESLVDRLHRTRDASVALKCLLAVHHIIKRGPFILQDQLSTYPASGGRNYLKLSAFRDCSSTASWTLSAWVRWYARYLETLLSASRVLGFFLCSSTCRSEKEKRDEQVSSFMNVDIIKDVDSLVAVIEDLCKVPDSLQVEGNTLLHDIEVLLSNDYYLSLVNEVVIRLSELKQRLSYLSFGESVELACATKRLEGCKERLLLLLISTEKPSTDILWGLTAELNGRGEVHREGGVLVTRSRRERVSESARFEDRVLSPFDTVRFSSGRFGLNEAPILAMSSTELITI